MHVDVPGTIYTRDWTLQHQPFVRPPSARPFPPDVKRHECLGTALQPYADRVGHFAHEVLPRIALLMRHTECPILVRTSPFVDAFLSHVQANASGRIVAWHDRVYFAKRVYAVMEVPYCTRPHPHLGGMSTFFTGRYFVP